MDTLILLVDENVERLDQKLYRVSICAVEVPDPEILEDLKLQMRNLKADKIRFGEVTKMHLSSLSESQRTAVVEVFSKLNVTAKIFVTYYFDGDEKTHKINAATSAINNLAHIHKGKKLDIKLEHADEYLSTPLEEILEKDEELFLAPDCFLGVFIAVLNNTSSQVGAHGRMYTLIREKIRLQVFNFADEKVYLKSEKRI